MPAGAARHPIPDRAFGIYGRAFRRPLLTCHARSDLLTLACCDLIAPRCPDFGKIPGEFQDPIARHGEARKLQGPHVFCRNFNRRTDRLPEIAMANVISLTR